MQARGPVEKGKKHFLMAASSSNHLIVTGKLVSFMSDPRREASELVLTSRGETGLVYDTLHSACALSTIASQRLCRQATDGLGH